MWRPFIAYLHNNFYNAEKNSMEDYGVFFGCRVMESAGSRFIKSLTSHSKIRFIRYKVHQPLYWMSRSRRNYLECCALCNLQYRNRPLASSAALHNPVRPSVARTSRFLGDNFSWIRHCLIRCDICLETRCFSRFTSFNFMFLCCVLTKYPLSYFLSISVTFDPRFLGYP